MDCEIVSKRPSCGRSRGLIRSLNSSGNSEIIERKHGGARMSEHLFLRTTIALVWDFDTTLIPGYMQEPLFRCFDVDGGRFWKEANALSQFYRERGVTRASKDT